MNHNFDMDIIEKYFSIIESLLFVYGEPISINQIADILGEDKLKVKSLMKEFMELYNRPNRGIKVFEIENSYQLGTKPENEIYIVKLLKTNQRQSLSQASIETLSIIAYKQPITRVQIEEIRGVRSDKAIQTLLEKKLIKEAGRLEVIGRPILYGTSDNFLKQFGMSKLEELPTFENVEIDEEDES